MVINDPIERKEKTAEESDFKGGNKGGLVVDPGVSRFQRQEMRIRRFGCLYVLINHREARPTPHVCLFKHSGNIRTTEIHLSPYQKITCATLSSD